VRLPLRLQIILPFFVLLLFIGMVGIGVVTARVTSATTGEFDNGLLRTSLLANEQLTTLEADRLSQLREVTDTEGVADAVAAGDVGALSRLLVAVAVNARPVELMIRVLNREGQQILVIERGVASGPGDRSSSPSYADIPAVQQALAGQKDALGDRYVFLGSDGPGPIVYWVGPARDDREQVLGVILLGQSLADLAGGVGKARASEVAFYDTDGQALTSSLPSLRSLRAHVLRRLTHDHPMRLTQTLDGHAFAFLVSDWTFRDVWLGYFAIALNTDAVLDSVGHVRNILVFLFVVAALLTLLLGSVLARRITRRLERLVGGMRAISTGDFAPRAASEGHDEIGYLGAAFNEMSQSLQEKTRAVEESHFASMEALARAIDARDRYTYGHSSRVAVISLELAAAMGLPPEECEALRRGALLHDIGKIGVEDRILRKPGPLTEEEWAAMRKHPLIGHEMLKGLPFLQRGLDAVRHHHERWDGAGYPDALRAEVIPAYARILSVADAIDAMTSDRPYRRRLAFETMSAAIMTGAGTQFDPAVVAAFTARAEAISALLEKMGKDVGNAEMAPAEAA